MEVVAVVVAEGLGEEEEEAFPPVVCAEVLVSVGVGAAVSCAGAGAGAGAGAAALFFLGGAPIRTMYHLRRDILTHPW